MMLESLKHGDSCFITLTYDQKHLPSNGSLVPKDTQDWLKRLRKAISPKKVRYFLVGEYGDDTWRPHYHVALFGLGQMHSHLIHSTWGKGHVLVGDLTPQSSAYIAGYVTKKMTSPNDPRLGTKHPEFARMSRKPGIGGTAMDDLAESLMTSHGSDLILKTGDVPTSLKHGPKSMPLGRYLRQKLRKRIGLDEEKIKQEKIWEYSAEMCQVLEEALNNKENRKKSFKTILVEKNRQRVLNLEARYNIYKKKGTL